MDFRSEAVKECEKIPSNDKIVWRGYEITHEVLTRIPESLFEEHTITIKWVQVRERGTI